MTFEYSLHGLVLDPIRSECLFLSVKLTTLCSSIRAKPTKMLRFLIGAIDYVYWSSYLCEALPDDNLLLSTVVGFFVISPKWFNPSYRNWPSDRLSRCARNGPLWQDLFLCSRCDAIDADSTTVASIANFYAVLLSRLFAKLRPLSRITAHFAKQSYKKDCRKLGTKMSSFDVRFLTTLLEPMRKIGHTSYLLWVLVIYKRC